MSGRHRKGGPPIDEPWAPEEPVAPVPARPAAVPSRAGPAPRPPSGGRPVAAPCRLASRPSRPAVPSPHLVRPVPTSPRTGPCRSRPRWAPARPPRRLPSCRPARPRARPLGSSSDAARGGPRPLVAGLVASRGARRPGRRVPGVAAAARARRSTRHRGPAADHAAPAGRGRAAADAWTPSCWPTTPGSRAPGSAPSSRAPSRSTPSAGAGTFGSIAPGGSGGAGDNAATALADLVNVTVDGSWVVDTTGLAALVDAVGGVDVTVDRDVTVTGRRRRADPGLRRQPAPERARPRPRTPRTSSAASPSRAGWPGSPPCWAPCCPSCPAGSRPGRSCSPASARTARRRSRPPPSATSSAACAPTRSATGSAFDTLPTHALDLGTGTPDPGRRPAGAAATLVSTNFSGSLPATRPGGADQRGDPERRRHARAWSPRRGPGCWSAASRSSTAATPSTFGYATRSCSSRTRPGRPGSSRAPPWPGRSGCRPSDVALTDQGQTIADVVVILGADFKP